MPMLVSNFVLASSRGRAAAGEMLIDYNNPVPVNPYGNDWMIAPLHKACYTIDQLLFRKSVYEDTSRVKQFAGRPALHDLIRRKSPMNSVIQVP